MLTTNDFHFHRIDNVLTAEISVIEARLNRRVKNDLQITSVHTGRAITFTLSKIERDREGDIEAFTFTSTETRTYVRLFND